MDGWNGIGPNHYQGNQDLVAKFRLFEDQSIASAQSNIGDYCDLYQSGPLTKAELLNRLADGLPVDSNFASKFQIKREGKDKDDLFWAFGKIHGLENIAFLSKDQILKSKGNPIAIQQMVDLVNDNEKPLPPGAHDATVDELSN